MKKFYVLDAGNDLGVHYYSNLKKAYDNGFAVFCGVYRPASYSLIAKVLRDTNIFTQHFALDTDYPFTMSIKKIVLY